MARTRVQNSSYCAASASCASASFSALFGNQALEQLDLLFDVGDLASMWPSVVQTPVWPQGAFFFVALNRREAAWIKFGHLRSSSVAEF
jgi:hypothetical protein